MNKRTVILERAKFRLADAENSAQDEQRKANIAHLIAHLIEENDVYFFQEPTENLLIIASLKAVTTLH